MWLRYFSDKIGARNGNSRLVGNPAAPRTMANGSGRALASGALSRNRLLDLLLADGLQLLVLRGAKNFL